MPPVSPTPYAEDKDRRRWIRIRMAIQAALFVPLVLLLFWRAMQLQVFDSSKLYELAKDQYIHELNFAGRRGTIADRLGTPLAATVEVDSIYANPAEIGDTARAAESLAKALRLDTRNLRRLLEGKSKFAWLKRRVTPQEAEAVKALELTGVRIVKEPRRYYPQRELAANLLGFAGLDGEGLDGIELAFDEPLKGKPLSVSTLRDARGRPALLDSHQPADSLQGAKVGLTIDSAIQLAAEHAVAKAVADSNAVSGMAVVLDPTTGELLALVTVPTFNPNDPGRYPKQAMRDRVVTDQFEPGSTVKVLTIAAALDQKAIQVTSAFDCERGTYAIGKQAIHDHGGYASLDVAKIIQVSSNIGAAKIGARLGRTKLVAAQRAFGLGEKPGTGLPGETRGMLPFPRSDIALATQSFGQGLTASAVQLAAAYGAIANGGALMRPFVVSSVIDSDGTPLFGEGPQKVRDVVTPATSREMLRMMRLVVEKGGTAPLAKLDAYAVAGKTGTAQKVDPKTGMYSVDKRTASFIGIVPADAPRLVIGVWIDEPQTDVYGGIVAAPAFKEIARAALAHLGVPPSNPSKVSVANVEPVAPSARSSALAAAASRGEEGSNSGEGFIEDGEGAASVVSVPNVVGLNARTAIQRLAAAGLEPSLAGSGTVVEQHPAAQTRLAANGKVRVVLESPLGRADRKGGARG